VLAGALWREGGRLRRLGILAVAAVVRRACWAGSAWPRHHLTGRAGAERDGAVLAAALVYVQIVFGAILTHAGSIDLHRAGAALVFVLVPIVATQLRRTGDAVAAPVTRFVTILLGIQLLLGIGSL
jgi:heme A synthase